MNYGGREGHNAGDRSDGYTKAEILVSGIQKPAVLARVTDALIFLPEVNQTLAIHCWQDHPGGNFYEPKVTTGYPVKQKNS